MQTPHINRRRIVAWSLGLLLLLLIWPGSFRLFFGADNEISYSAGFDFTTCSGFLANESIDSERCRAEYRITIGNTGSEVQQQILLELAPVPPTWRLATSVTDIVASAQEKIQPAIEHEQLASTLNIRIEDLHPNRVVRLQIITIGADAAELLATTEAHILSDGTIVQSNPELTVVARFFRSLFSAFGL